MASNQEKKSLARPITINLSDVRQHGPPAQIVAVLTSDIHLSHKCPTVRSAEDDWYDVMRRGLRELSELSKLVDAPVIIAGDLFDKWNVPPSLINLAIDELPKHCYTIPGQHDLPHHNREWISDSAYGTLVKAKRIYDMGTGRFTLRDLCVHAFPWGKDLTNRRLRKDSLLNIAVVHKYFWKRGHGYEGADEERTPKKMQDFLDHYDACVFGDNHQGFFYGSHVINCGTFFRRKADEIAYKPQVGLLTSRGTIVRCYLDRDDDKFIDLSHAMELVETAMDMSEFAGALSKLGSDSLDFLATVKKFLDANKISNNVAQRVMEAIDGRPKL